jgi:predicted amidohydrolase YtcJ
MAARNGPRDRRPCTAHNQVIQPGDVARFGKAGVIPVVTPYWAGDLDGVIDRLGPVRNEWQYPYASLAKTGATLAFCSDWPVQTPSPLAGMSIAIRRIEPGMKFPLVPSEALTPMQSLLGYTQGAAYAVFEESRQGMLKKGMRGDIVVLARNPLTTPVEEWPGIRLLSTWRAGVRTYAAPTAATGGQSPESCRAQGERASRPFRDWKSYRRCAPGGQGDRPIVDTASGKAFKPRTGCWRFRLSKKSAPV